MSDPREKLGTPTPSDPITGKLKLDTKPESLPDFAERHGWQIRHYPNESMGYYQTYRFVKNLNIIDLTQWSDSSWFVNARFNGIDLPSLPGKEMRTRIERAISGVSCSCTFKDWPEEHVIDAACLIHGEAA